MSRGLLALLALALCVLAGGCFRAELDPGVRVRAPRAKVKAC